MSLILIFVKQFRSYSETSSKQDRRWVKRELQQHFGEDLIVMPRCGKDDVIASRSTVDSIVRSLNDGEIPQSEDLKQIIVKLAGKILMENRVQIYWFRIKFVTRKGRGVH